MKQLAANGKTVFYEYDDVQDMLYVLFEPINGLTYYDDLLDVPEVMLRYNAENDRLIGFTANHVKHGLNGEQPAIASIDQTVLKLLHQVETHTASTPQP